MRCETCGAGISDDATVCEYCGSHVTRTAVADSPPDFERIRQSPQWQQRQSSERIARLPKLSGLQKTFPIVFGFVFCGATLFMTVMFMGVGGQFSMIPVCMGIVPLGMFVLGVFMVITQMRKVNSIESGTLTAIAAVVAGKRIEVQGGENSTSTNYFATFETEDGQRDEYQLWDGKLYGQLDEDDMGVLFLRDGKYAVDFDRVR